jgi:hypothetical protein
LSNGNPKILSVIERYLKYKLSLYASRFYANHDRQLFHGAFDAWRDRFQLLNADEAGLSDAYKSLCDRYLPGQNPVAYPPPTPFVLPPGKQ